jgi:hypothetical protein
VKFYQVHGRNDSDSVVEKYKEMESYKIQEVQKCKMDLQTIVKELEGFNGVLKKATEMELSLRKTMEILNLKMKKKNSLMRHLMDDSKYPLYLHPS